MVSASRNWSFTHSITRCLVGFGEQLVSIQQNLLPTYEMSFNKKMGTETDTNKDAPTWSGKAEILLNEVNPTLALVQYRALQNVASATELNLQ